MNRIESMFADLKKKKETALIPFITAGDPDIQTTEALVIEMAKNGADLIELGLPFSDPLADGPTIQAASQRALAGGMNTEKFFKLSAKIREKTEVPLVLMGYYNPIYKYGLEKFAKDAAQAGIDGTIIPDLPLEESGPWMKAAKKNGLANIFLIAPNTPSDRIKKIGKASQGFLYYVSVTGITGARTELPPELAKGLNKAQKLVSIPLAVGFGISKPEQVAMLSEVADGIIVGSAIVKLIEKNSQNLEKAIKEVGKFVKSLKKATKPA